jgi:hypothetical protein
VVLCTGTLSLKRCGRRPILNGETRITLSQRDGFPQQGTRACLAGGSLASPIVYATTCFKGEKMNERYTGRASFWNCAISSLDSVAIPPTAHSRQLMKRATINRETR